MTSNRRLATAAAVLALLSLGVFIRDQLPKPNDLVFAPFSYGAHAPKIGVVGDVRATVADTVNGIPTHAAWLVVDFAYEPDELLSLQGEIEAADGTLYGAANHMLMACGPRYPGLVTQCTLVFEMPAEQIEGARLLVRPPSSQMAPEASVPLPAPAAQRDIVREGVQL